MENIFLVLCLVFWGLFFFGFIGFAVLSFYEGEKKATRRAIFLALVMTLFFFVPIFLFPFLQFYFLLLFAILLMTGIVLFFLPFGNVAHGAEIAQHQIDERDVMFARARLKPDCVAYDSYYAMRPQAKLVDDSIRKKPGLMNPKASLYHEIGVKTAQACFEIPEALRQNVDGPVYPQKSEVDISVISKYIKQVTKYYGARNVGICELKPEHIYSNIGRGTGTYGAPITLKHRYAIAFSLEMDFDQVACGPEIPITMESARQYSNGAVIAVQLASLIRSMGYPARAHIDGNYRVIAPLVARDAGLGEIGRMGLVMTPELGPRVRLGVVTTDLPLHVDQAGKSNAMLHFCEICKKCADNCPSRSISMDERKTINGAVRWQINQETCFRYWSLVGTDCGKCVAVCPFSHPDNAAHNLVRWAIARSGFARYMALYLDDFFYGRKPVSNVFPQWIP